MDVRQPITLDILICLIDLLEHVCSLWWDKLLFRSMFLLAFFNFLLRVGDMTVSNNNENMLIIDCIKTVENSHDLVLHFKKFKHLKRAANAIIDIQDTNVAYCPVRAWHDYNKVRGNAPGFMYLKAIGKPLSGQNFTEQLALCLKYTGLNGSHQKSHSFSRGSGYFYRIQGFRRLDAQIQALERWNSDAFIKYIRF